ncbi:cation diffusion facilitator family transporter [Neomicrococcus lactis]|uniref:Cobalt-zinc-cadmium efflux system protein n=1 Tax=Neomicrococcus lactis TaxID=732241 RepID=A0A7W8YB52_9MICC|nr:cation diffusion facilitator family transporter [Neomicrococcus lactis]MBB5598303.1 cobalt-zinc-cadmium efflux system protein [Neomicrococcus lactis]
MGVGHSHGSGGHSHGPAAGAPAGHVGGKYRRRLAVSFALIAVFFVVELVFGLLSGSLSLLSDAGHMAADVVALGAALAATKIAAKSDRSGHRTFGSYRAEIFASGLAVLLMLGVSIYIMVEAVGRIGADPQIQTGPMIIVGALGLVINLIVMFLLRSGASESINVKGAYLEVVADTAGSVGVIAAGLLITWTGSPWWDTIVAVAIGLFVMVRAVMLGRQVLSILSQHAPPGLDVEQVYEELRKVPGVADVHDLHVWVLTSGMNVATAHIVARNVTDHSAILNAAQALLRDDFGIEHATLQVEQAASHECHEATW